MFVPTVNVRHTSSLCLAPFFYLLPVEEVLASQCVTESKLVLPAKWQASKSRDTVLGQETATLSESQQTEKTVGGRTSVPKNYLTRVRLQASILER